MAETLGVLPQATADVTQATALTGHRGWASAVAISPDGSWLASAGDDRAVRIWDASTGHALARISRLRDLTRVKDVSRRSSSQAPDENG